MTLGQQIRTLDWWLWAASLAALIFGLIGSAWGFVAVMALSAGQTLYYALKRGAGAFPTQVRLVYGLMTLAAWFDPTRLLYAALAFGTLMVCLFDRCFIARVLVHMPWNRGVELQ